MQRKSDLQYINTHLLPCLSPGILPLGLAQCSSRLLSDFGGYGGIDFEIVKSQYLEVLREDSQNIDAVIELGEMFCKRGDIDEALRLYTSYSSREHQRVIESDAFIHGEICRLLIKQGKLSSPTLEKSLIGLGLAYSVRMVEPYIEQIEDIICPSSPKNSKKSRYKSAHIRKCEVNSKQVFSLLKRVYANIAGKSILHNIVLLRV
eukprot:UC4_evm3s794